MNNKDLALKVLSALENGDYDTATNLIADDFVFAGPVPEPVNKEMWFGLQKSLYAAIPDWTFNQRDVYVEGETVHMTFRVRGTHTNELDLTPLGLGVIPATGKPISLPAEQVEILVEDNKISSFIIEANPDAGLNGILKQIGVEIPSRG